MTKVKVSEASGVVLDWMVALTLGHNIVWDGIAYWINDLNTSKPIGSKWMACGKPYGWSPSNYWEHGGPIIARERISIEEASTHGGWIARTSAGVYALPRRRHYADGPHPLISAMRCFATSRLGPEVEVPDELLEK